MSLIKIEFFALSVSRQEYIFSFFLELFKGEEHSGMTCMSVNIVATLYFQY